MIQWHSIRQRCLFEFFISCIHSILSIIYCIVCFDKTFADLLHAFPLAAQFPSHYRRATEIVTQICSRYCFEIFKFIY